MLSLKSFAYRKCNAAEIKKCKTTSKLLQFTCLASKSSNRTSFKFQCEQQKMLKIHAQL